MIYYELMSTARNMLHSLPILYSRLSSCPLVHRQSGFCIFLSSKKRFCEISEKSRSLLHTSASNGLENGNNKQNFKTQLPSLMNNPPKIIWPNLSTIDLLNLGMITTFDKEFTLQQFYMGALQALNVISNALSQGDLESLEELLDNETYYEIKENFRKNSRTNQLTRQLAVNLQDVVIILPYNTNITRYHDTKNDVEECFVEISVCFHTIRNFKNMLLLDGFKPGEKWENYLSKLIVCHYRFIREYTKGVEDQWSVNMVHHFKCL